MKITIAKVGTINTEGFDRAYVCVRSMTAPVEGATQLAALAPSKELFRDYRRWVAKGVWNQEKFDSEYKPRFLEEVMNSREAVRLIRAMVKHSREGMKIALMCYCKDYSLCHRSILAEILRGAGAEVEVVNTKKIGFNGDNYFLNTMYPVSIKLGSYTFRSAESAFQAYKCRNGSTKRELEKLNGYDARKLGKKIMLRSDWSDRKLKAMWIVQCAKFAQHPDLYKKLCETHDFNNANEYGDRFWGTCNGDGANILGMMLELIGRGKGFFDIEDPTAREDVFQSFFVDGDLDLPADIEAEELNEKLNLSAKGDGRFINRIFEQSGSYVIYKKPCIDEGSGGYSYELEEYAGLKFYYGRFTIDTMRRAILDEEFDTVWAWLSSDVIDYIASHIGEIFFSYEDATPVPREYLKDVLSGEPEDDTYFDGDIGDYVNRHVQDVRPDWDGRLRSSREEPSYVKAFKTSQWEELEARKSQLISSEKRIFNVSEVIRDMDGVIVHRDYIGSFDAYDEALASIGGKQNLNRYAIEPMTTIVR